MSSALTPATAVLGVGPEDVLAPRFWLGSAVNARGQILGRDGSPVTASGVTFLWRAPDGVQVELAGIWDTDAGLWRCAYEPEADGAWTVRLRSQQPQRQTDWQPFVVLAETMPGVAAPAAALWLTQQGNVLASTNGGLISAARVDELPEMQALEGATLPGVEAGGGSARLPVQTLRDDAREQARQEMAPRLEDIDLLLLDVTELQAWRRQQDYVQPAVSGLTVSPAVAETGATLTSVTLAVTRNRPDLPAVISQAGVPVGTVAPGQSTITLAGSWSADATWTATVTDPAPPPGLPASGSRLVTLPFRLRRYWGLSASATPDDAAIRALASELATAASARRSATLSPAGQYVVYAQPAAWPIADSVVVGGFATTAFVDTLRDVVSPTGHAEPYRIRVLTYPLTGTNLEILF